MTGMEKSTWMVMQLQVVALVTELGLKSKSVLSARSMLEKKENDPLLELVGPMECSFFSYFQVVAARRDSLATMEKQIASTRSDVVAVKSMLEQLLELYQTEHVSIQ